MEANDIIAPFVLKTYQMVNDPSTDALIVWGHANNSFIVIEPLDFSQRILPAYFKHNNFSSFVRQLNTYGFRKVDPDRWEFANEWFLRGQIHLLKNIVRRNHCKNHKIELGMKDEEIYKEIARLRQEQVALEEELQGMNKRLEATERRPQQMMAFLRKVVEDPDLLPRMEQTRQQLLCDKKRRLMISPSSSSSSYGMTAAATNSLNSVKSEEEEEGNQAVISSPETGTERFGTDSSPEMNQVAGWFGRVSSPISPGTGTANLSRTLITTDFDEINRRGQIGYFGQLASAVEGRPPPPYPFSLLEGGF
ncbi:hypothetical protein HS088_TW09G01027 [Tripterygium wilfordii]|uniref:HSF-type DNA-binding domain-containing protein n=1 Tax=Tripterygium wilfordii TaxID=458696 RepID=A0A7J7D9C0_TRIWF|nr:heat stress transcription factor C-1 [Tripterygium wilfordii]KAF5742965.1 hypothetical protein HS088_TW09G01027 [Tripterygium wilfordii]